MILSNLEEKYQERPKMKNNFYVYVLKDPDTLEPFYVGKGHGKRAEKHKHIPKTRKLTHKDNKILKLKSEGKFYIIEYIAENLFEKEAFDLEIKLISDYGRQDLKTGILCNHTNGGEGYSGWSQERKQEYSERHKGIISARDSEDNIFRVSKEDPRWISGELVGINFGKKVSTMKKNFIIAKDKKGNNFSVSKNDPRWISGELVGIRKGLKPHINSIEASKANKGKSKPEGFGDKVSRALSGKEKSEEHKENLRQAGLNYYKNNPSREVSDDTKIVMKEAALKRSKIECQYCKRSFDPGNYSQHHGEKCKLNPNNVKAH